MTRPPVAITFPLFIGLVGILVVLRVLWEPPVGRVQTFLWVQKNTLKSNQFPYHHIDLFISFMAASPVPYVYSVFVRDDNPKNKFSELEKAQMMARNSTHLLPTSHSNRKKLIAWVVSNNHPSNNRVDFAKAISNFIKVDIYGRGNMELRKSAHSFQWLSTKYKFYLAFENSNCRNYITEKAYVNALRNDMVPIVLGAYKEDYENALPPHSYINVDDFKSIRQLADYLAYLNKNDTAYASYFAWKEYGKIVTINRPDCRLCGFMYHLNAGRIALPKSNPSYFTNPKLACFNRPLLPLQ
ncbi:Glycoprotein 3-alpha-L-fucosyltransferase A [Taenia solium]